MALFAKVALPLLTVTQRTLVLLLATSASPTLRILVVVLGILGLPATRLGIGS